MLPICTNYRHDDLPSIWFVASNSLNNVDIIHFTDDKLNTDTHIPHNRDSCIHQQDLFLHKKACVKWLKEGDIKTTFFYTFAKIRGTRNGISSMEIKIPYFSIVNCSIWYALKNHYVVLLKECRWLIEEHSKRKFLLDNWIGYIIADRVYIPNKNLS